MSKILLLFIDGIGIGKNDRETNPFFKYNFKLFSHYFTQPPDLLNPNQSTGSAYYWGTDACMGIEGLPQSGTGQTSIFCGVNASEIIGKHFGPYPYSTLIPIIKEENIFKTLIDKGKSVNFVNAYPKLFFDYLKSGKQRLSVTTLSCRLNATRLKSVTDLRKGKALSAEIDNSRWKERLNYNIPVIKPKTAAARLLRIAGQNDFTVYEYFLTDHFGHLRHPDYLEYGINILNEFLYELFVKLPKDITILICSDHGNFEDISTKTHTRNPALCISAGPEAEHFSKKISSLKDIKPSIMEIIN